MSKQSPAAFGSQTASPVRRTQAIPQIRRAWLPRARPEPPPADEDTVSATDPIPQSSPWVRTPLQPFRPLGVGLLCGGWTACEVAHDHLVSIEPAHQADVAIADSTEVEPCTRDARKHELTVRRGECSGSPCTNDPRTAERPPIGIFVRATSGIDRTSWPSSGVTGGELLSSEWSRLCRWQLPSSPGVAGSG